MWPLARSWGPFDEVLGFGLIKGWYKRKIWKSRLLISGSTYNCRYNPLIRPRSRLSEVLAALKVMTQLPWASN